MDFGSFFIGVINTFISDLGATIGAVLAILPNSPFTWSLGALQSYVNWLNYFLPISAIVVELPYYLSAVTAYYLIRVVLRWIKLAE